ASASSLCSSTVWRRGDKIRKADFPSGEYMHLSLWRGGLFAPFLVPRCGGSPTGAGGGRGGRGGGGGGGRGGGGAGEGGARAAWGARGEWMPGWGPPGCRTRAGSTRRSSRRRSTLR